VVVKRIVGATLAVLVAFGAQVAQGAPAGAIRAMRAMSCCATRCHHSVPARGASECCRTSTDEQTATVGAVPAAPEAVAASTVLAAPAAADAVGVRLDAAPAPHARGAPVFLLVRSIRV
jgi:hypothetical protein